MITIWYALGPGSEDIGPLVRQVCCQTQGIAAQRLAALLLFPGPCMYVCTHAYVYVDISSTYLFLWLSTHVVVHVCVAVHAIRIQLVYACIEIHKNR